MVEEIIEYNKLNTFQPKEQIKSLVIQNIPSTEIFAVEKLYELSLKLIDNGALKLVYDSKINDEIISQIKTNIIFAGLVNISINNNQSMEILCTKKEWPNNSVNEYKDLDPKNIKNDGPGVDASHLIDPYTTYIPKLKYVPISNAKPCANCVCGRAAALKKQNNDKNHNCNNDEKKIEIKDNKGGCGRCHLSDEFRCANCPYRGLPAFNKNELNKGIENNEEIEKVKMNIENNVVKIDV